MPSRLLLFVMGAGALFGENLPLLAQDQESDRLIELAIASYWRASPTGVEARARGDRFAARYYDVKEGWVQTRVEGSAARLASDFQLGLAPEDTIAVKCAGSAPGKCGLLGSTGVVSMSRIRVSGNQAFAEIAVWFWTPPAERREALKPELPSSIFWYELRRDTTLGWSVLRVRQGIK